MTAVAERITTWQAHAACNGSGATADFFSDDPVQITRAKKICDGCPVREECLSFARASREQTGIWGGLTPEERGVVVVQRDGCFSCGGVLVPLSDTRDTCLSCGSVWYA